MLTYTVKVFIHLLPFFSNHMRRLIIAMRTIGKASMIIQIFKNPLYAALKTVVSYVYFMKMVHGIQIKLAKKAQTVAMKKMIVVQK